MKEETRVFKTIKQCSLALAAILAASQLQASPAIQKNGGTGDAAVKDNSEDDAAAQSGQRKQEKDIIIRSIEPSSDEAHAAHKEVPWLGLSTEEASEALSSQLGLARGVGLVITYITPDSPAAKAGLQKNDVLVEFDDQSLVVPAQFRKLVQAHKEGDTVNLAYYRAGKKETASVTVGKTTARGFGLLEDDRAWQGDLRDLQRQLKDLPIRDAIREQMKSLRESLGNLRIDQKKVQEELRRSLEAARKAMEEALRHASNAHFGLDPAKKALKELENSDAFTDNRSTVTVRSSGKSVKSVVKADDSGTIVIVNSPKLHLTAHDKEGKLLFDGEIATSEQRDQVPRDLWERVEPLVDKMDQKAEEE